MIRLFTRLLLVLLALSLTNCAPSGSTVAAARKMSVVREVRAMGAVGDGKNKDTLAFQKAIDSAAAAGGGTVIVPQGEYLIGSIVLTSHVTLHLDNNATLIGSPDKDDYPISKIRWEGRLRDGHRALIFAENQEDVAITGGGKIVGAAPLGHLRNPRGPCIMEFLKCETIHLEDFTVNYERMWAIHPTFCKDVYVRNLKIRSTLTNGDGIDVDSCNKVRIENCDIDAGDDAIALKSGRGQEGVDLARPTEDVVISGCTLGSAFAGLAIGTEMSGGIRNVRFDHCTFTRGSNSIFIKSRTGRGGYIEDIEGHDLDCRASAFLRIDLMTKGTLDEQSVQGPAGIPVAKNFRFSKVKADVPFLVDAVLISPDKPLDGLTLQDITGTAKRGIELANIRHADLRKIDVNVESGPVLAIENVTGNGLEKAEKLKPRPPATTRSTRRRPTSEAVTEPTTDRSTNESVINPPATQPASTNPFSTAPTMMP